MTEIALSAPKPPRRWLADALSTVLWLVVVVLLACQVLLWSEPTSPRLAVVEQFAVQFSVAAIVFAVAAAVARRWLLVALMSLLAATFAWPALASYGTGPVAAVGPERLKIVSANLWARAADHRRTLDFLMASDADIIGLVEAVPEWRRSLAPLIAKYPYSVDCFAVERVCQTMVLSRLPISKSKAGRVWGTVPIIAGGEVSWSGRTFTVIATHLTRPLQRNWRHASQIALPGSLPANRQAEQLDTLAKFVNTLPSNVIVMGDFNAAPWSRVQRGFREITGLGSAAGWAFTWPSWLPTPARLSIDHVLARGNVVVTNFEAGPETDSDHLPVVAEIGWRD